MLRQKYSKFTIQTLGEGFIDITSTLNHEVALSALHTGIAALSCHHTSCSLTINENADPRVLEDLAAFLKSIVPEEGIKPVSGVGGLRPWVHNDEGPDDMPAHIRTALTCSHISLSFNSRKLLLGTWQAVYLWEHRRRGSNRLLSLHMIGE